jgi:hypothetical protein
VIRLTCDLGWQWQGLALPLAQWPRKFYGNDADTHGNGADRCQDDDNANAMMDGAHCIDVTHGRMSTWVSQKRMARPLFFLEETIYQFFKKLNFKKNLILKKT